MSSRDAIATDRPHRRLGRGIRAATPLGVALLWAAAMLLGGCDVKGLIIKDEVAEATESGEVTKEMRGRVVSADLELQPDGSATLNFAFVYLIGLIDPEGIDRIPWTYALLHPDQTVLGSGGDEMRAPNPELTAILVHSDTAGRSRTLAFAPGRVVPNQTYVLWVTLYYRDAVFYEVLVPLEVGVPYRDPVNPEELPELLNSF